MTESQAQKLKKLVTGYLADENEVQIARAFGPPGLSQAEHFLLWLAENGFLVVPVSKGKMA